MGTPRVQDMADTASAPDLEAENRRLSQLLVSAGIDPATGRSGTRAGDRFDPRRHDELAFATVLLDSMSEGFYVVDPNGRTTICNQAMLRMLGFATPDEVIGTSTHDLIHHHHADGSAYPVATCPIYRAAREGISMVVDNEVFFRRDGTSFPVEYRTEPLIRDGRLDGAICTFVDISHRVGAEQRLRESEGRLALATRAGGIGIWDYDVVNGMLRWDERVRSLFGVAPDAAVGLAENLDRIHPGDRATVEAALARAFDPLGDGAYHVRFRIPRDDEARVRWVEAQGQATFEAAVAVRLVGVLRDISKEREAERHLRLMVNELNHRVKNSLAMVQGVAAQTFRHSTDMETARTAFTERLVALARAHDVLTASRWEGADLAQVVALTAQTHAGDQGERFDVAGPRIALSPKAVLAFSVALHELATNAVKYGALSNAAGRVTIRWRIDGPEADRRLSFAWVESDGPAIDAPQRRGFGTKLIERGLASELQGHVGIEFPRTGLICRIDAPLPTTLEGSIPE